MKLDLHQSEVSQHLDRLAREIQHTQARPKTLHALLRFFSRKHESRVRGLYIWGGVGRGKTMLMDSFFESIATQRKRRSHFHRFMQEIHSGLKDVSGRTNPLEEVADHLAQEVAVLCLDEFFVSDIGDAMILGELLRAMFERNVILVATSNIEPRRLYENGLQRRRFLPAIKLIELNTEVVFLGGDTDYRLRALRNRDLYRIGAGTSAELIRSDIEELIGQSNTYIGPLTVNGRDIQTLYRTDGIAAFSFREICEGPRNAYDYIEIARTHHTVAIYEVPVLTGHHESATRRFISLIDVFYDHNVNLLLHAAQPIQNLYTGERHRNEFERTQSRIVEMSSAAFLAKAHIA